MQINFTNNDSTQDLRRHSVTKTSNLNSGVYAIPCTECDSFYVGGSDNVDHR